MELDLEIPLHDNQMKVHESKARFRVLCAGRRFGKTTLAIDELIINALETPDLYWYIAPSYRQAKMIAWKMLKAKVPKELILKVNESELSISLVTGGEIELKGADNEDALRGAGVKGMVVDEFASIYDNWSVWNEVLRPSLADKKGWVLFIGTPKGKDAFYELWLNGKRGGDWESWTFTTVDNPYIDPTEVKEAKETMPERYYRQEFEASFEDFEGLIYPEFSKKHIVPSFPIPEDWEITGVIDPAISGTTAVIIFAADEHENVYAIDEFYEQDQRVSDVAQAVKDKAGLWIIDPASQQKTQVKEGKRYSLFDEYSEYGIYPRPAENDVDAGINRVGEYFKQGKLKVFSKCTSLIYELERYHWAESKESIKGEVKAQPYKKLDHACDCARYYIMSRPSPATIDHTPKVEPMSLEAWERRMNIGQSEKFA